MIRRESERFTITQLQVELEDAQSLADRRAEALRVAREALSELIYHGPHAEQVARRAIAAIDAVEPRSEIADA